ncbi:MAG: M14 family zinc carboxypeptidase [Bacteroidia bacterium]
MFAQNTQYPLTPFELNNQKSATYEEIITYYQGLAKQSRFVTMREIGNFSKKKNSTVLRTDIGKPLHLVLISNDKSIEISRQKGKAILFINNGIHPGEPEGIDASMMLAREILEQQEKDLSLQKKQGKKGTNTLLDKVTIAILPVYNVDGCLNRGSFSRANQNGPEEYGFRGNAQNLDLNRDFVKCDSRNALLFNEVFTYLKPHIFVDTHTSNGADYPYTMTLIPTQKDKLPAVLAEHLTQKLLPYLYEEMAKRSWEMCPYVNADETPDGGIYGFLDLPRYSTGYAALHNAIGFMPETHMLKPFVDRVKSTYQFLDVVLQYVQANQEVLVEVKKQADAQTQMQAHFPIRWELEAQKTDSLLFKGYEAKYKPSLVSGLPRLYYDTSAPYEKNIAYWNTYKSSLTVSKPIAYIIPQAYDKVIRLLEKNGVEMERLTEDKVFSVEMYRVEQYETSPKPYEGHYLHSKVKVKIENHTKRFYQGDYVVKMNQTANRYLVETLEPQAHDSFFAWNFFDAILQQKEHFSAYIFEDLAANLLAKDSNLANRLADEKAKNPELAKSAEAQLEWVYKNSPYYEPTHNLYPIARLMK